MTCERFHKKAGSSFLGGKPEVACHFFQREQESALLLGELSRSEQGCEGRIDAAGEDALKQQHTLQQGNKERRTFRKERTEQREDGACENF